MKKLLVFFLFTMCVLNIGGNVFASANSPTVFINEFLPDALGSDSGKEWVELFNSSNNSIDLTGWSITTQSIASGIIRKTVLSASSIQPNSYLIIAEDSSLFAGSNKVVVGAGKLNMYNSEAVISLLDKSNNVVDTLTYHQELEAKSFERKGPLASLSKCTTLDINLNGNTIGAQNLDYDKDCWPSVAPISYPISFPVSYVPSYPVSYVAPISYPVKPPAPSPLPVPTPQPNPVSYPNSYPGTSPASYPASYPSTSPTSYPIANPTTIQISELYPSPDTSAGESEWLELYNYGSKGVDLSHWYLKDKGTSGHVYGTSTNLLPEIILDPGAYLVVNNLKISLNNAGDTITLFSNSGNLIDQVTYPSTDKGIAEARKLVDDRYSSGIFATTIPTPDGENEFPEVAADTSTTQTNSTSNQTTVHKKVTSKSKKVSSQSNSNNALVLAESDIVNNYAKVPKVYDITTLNQSKAFTKYYVWPLFAFMLLLTSIYASLEALQNLKVRLIVKNLFAKLEGVLKYVNANPNF